MSVMNIDLHIHSSFSDGAFTPAELVARAKEQDVSVIAIADHDSVSGIREASLAATASYIEIIPAVELSTRFQDWNDVHLLGYGIDYEDEVFLHNLDGFKEFRKSRNDEILKRVNDCLQSEGRDVIEGDCVRYFARGAIGRPHIARALLERGYANSVEDAFRRYLVPCNIPKNYWLISDAINEIHRVGGVAVLAHPTSISKDADTLDSLIVALKLLGLDGIEVYNNMGWPLEIEFLRRMAERYRLLMTAGSDFHGIEEGLEIGRGREGIRFDSSLLAPLYERMKRI